MFSNSSDVQITGGNFINVGRDFNFETGQAAGDWPNTLTQLDFGVGPRRLVGAKRPERRSYLRRKIGFTTGDSKALETARDSQTQCRSF
jgi:hypothetical protein